MILYIFAILFALFIVYHEDVDVKPFGKFTGRLILSIIWPITLSALVFKWGKSFFK